jgi:hypothetical protein
MMYFVFFDGLEGLEPGKYSLVVETRSGLKLKSASHQLLVGHRDEPSFT